MANTINPYFLNRLVEALVHSEARAARRVVEGVRVLQHEAPSFPLLQQAIDRVPVTGPLTALSSTQLDTLCAALVVRVVTPGAGTYCALSPTSAMLHARLLVEAVRELAEAVPHYTAQRPALETAILLVCGGDTKHCPQSQALLDACDEVVELVAEATAQRSITHILRERSIRYAA